MRIALTLASLAAVGFLAACNSEEAACTEEQAQQKLTELTTKLQEIGTADPAKLAEYGPKLTEMATQMAAAPDDLQAACKAMDDMMAELN